MLHIVTILDVVPNTNYITSVMLMFFVSDDDLFLFMAGGAKGECK